MRCHGRNKSLVRCSREQKTFFCRDHKFQPIVWLSGLLAILGSLASLYSVFNDSDQLSNKVDVSIVCDRNKDLGCYIDIPVELLAFTNRPVTGRVEGPVVSFSVSYGNYNMIIPDIQPDYDHTLANFPIYIPSDRKKFLLVKSGLGMKLSNVLEKKHEGQVDGPYQFWMDNNMINFRGKLKDLYSNELIGWFDDNEFGVIKPCSFSWNKDRGGVEILDRYGNVIFSVNTIIINKQNGDIKVDGLNFKGYFRTEDKYYIFNDTTSFVTDNIKEAEKLIAEIEPVFDHYGRYSQGIRLGKEIDK